MIGRECPKCGSTSFHPKDVEDGWCERCEEFTNGELVEEDFSWLYFNEEKD